MLAVVKQWLLSLLVWRSLHQVIRLAKFRSHSGVNFVLKIRRVQYILYYMQVPYHLPCANVFCQNQAAFMVPTELLAIQHYEHVLSLLQALADGVCKPSVALLTGSTPTKQSRAVLEACYLFYNFGYVVSISFNDPVMNLYFI